MRSHAIKLAVAVLLAIGREQGGHEREQEAKRSAEVGSRESAVVDFTRMPFEELKEHETGTHKDVRVDLDEEGQSYDIVGLDLIVDVNGNVISAIAGIGPKEAFTAAEAEAKTWKYKPFEKDGKPVVAEIIENLKVFPLEDNS